MVSIEALLLQPLQVLDDLFQRKVRDVQARSTDSRTFARLMRTEKWNLGLAFEALLLDGCLNPTPAVTSSSSSSSSSFSSSPGSPSDAVDSVKAMWDRVPSLSDAHAVSGFQSGSLVRFRCLVQDSLDPEHYLSVYSTESHTSDNSDCIDSSSSSSASSFSSFSSTSAPPGSGLRTGKYREALEALGGGDANEMEFSEDIIDHPASILMERGVYYCIPIPGESDWVTQALVPPPTPAYPFSSAAEAHATKKRTRTDDIYEDTMDEDKDSNCNHMRLTKKSRQNDGSCPSPLLRLSAPRDRVECLVKTYDESFSSLKVGDAVEFLGIFSTEAPDISEVLDPFERDLLPFSPPISDAYRLHAISYRRVGTTVDHHIDQPSRRKGLDIGYYSSVRSSLLEYLTHICGGDTIVAEVILVSMMSRIYQRKYDMPLGRMTVNLCTGNAALSSTLSTTSLPISNQAFARVICTLFSQLLPRVVEIPLTVDVLNKQKWFPTRGDDEKHIQPARLQLAKETFILIDETVLKSGKIEDVGIQNLSALNKVASKGLLNYSFSSFTPASEFPVDTPVFCISEVKSLTYQDIRIPLRARYGVPSSLPDSYADNSARMSTASTSQVPANWGVWRDFISRARYCDFAFEEGSAKILEEGFLSLRKPVNAQGVAVSEQHLHTRTSFARLYCMSHLETALTPDRWTEAMKLMDEAQNRTNPVSSSSSPETGVTPVSSTSL